MKQTTTLYYVEVKEDIPKRVPHTKGKKYTEFLVRSSAVKFLNELVANNPRNYFRLCKETTTHTSQQWQTKK